MTIIHLALALIASVRLTDLLMGDAVMAPVRRWLPKLPWTCARCVSVWAGIIATVLYVWAPWVNWPLACSWLYLIQAHWRVRPSVGRRLIIDVDVNNHAHLTQNDFDDETLPQVLQAVMFGHQSGIRH